MKAIERQARKLRGKGIAVDLETLKNDYIAQHKDLNCDSSESEDEHQIDVVGDDDADCSNDVKDSISFKNNSESCHKTSSKSNPFSIERLLFEES